MKAAVRSILSIGGGFVCLWLVLRPQVGAAQHVPFDPAPKTVAEIDTGFADRALRVLRFNACGREQDFAAWQAAAAEGEDILDIVIAKIAFLNASLSPCEETAVLERPLDPGEDASPEALAARGARTAEYAAAQLKAFDDGVASGSNCAARAGVIVVDRTYTLRFSVPRACLKIQVNDVLGRYVRDRQLGSSGAPCVRSTHAVNALLAGDKADVVTTVGDFDVDVRQLVRALYLGGTARTRSAGQIIDAATIDHLFQTSLVVRGEPDSGSYSIYGCGNTEDSTGSPEDYADDQDWLGRALGDVGDAFDDFWKFLRKLWLTQVVVSAASGGAASVLPFVFAVDVADPNLIPDPVEPFDVRVPETENHRLMIESSRWLTNQWMIDVLAAEDSNYPNLDVLRDQQAQVRDWLLHRMQDIAQHDFVEYNSRAYQRYSINAIVNLYDFALNIDPALELGSRVVLDGASAKFAVGSNRARRFAPFRRLENNDGYGKKDDGTDQTAPRYLYNYASGADHQVPRFLVLAGQTQLLPSGLDQGGIGELVNVAASRYRLAEPIAALALDRAAPVFQRVHHTGIEIYSSAASYLLSAGGIPTPASGRIAFLDRNTDHGVAMPTVLIAAAGAELPGSDHAFGVNLDELFRFEGIGVGHARSPDTCVWRGIACGVNFRVPDELKKPGCLNELVSSTGRTWTLSSARCPEFANGPHFYLAARQRDCPGAAVCKEGMDNFGVLIVADAPLAAPAAAQDPQFDLFASFASSWLQLPAEGSRATVRNADGDTVVIDFDPPRIVSTGADPPLDEGGWPLFSDGPIQSGGDGKIVVSVSGQRTLTLDFSRWNAPTVDLR
jgi:hypothetical protein